MGATVPLKNMKRAEIENEVARLDGLLSGIAAFSGKIRDYSAHSYLIELDSEVSSIESSLKKFFSAQANLFISHIEHLENGLITFEHAIRHYLVRDTSHVSTDDQFNLCKYLSFRIIEIISIILEGDRYVDVLKIDGGFDASDSECVFFCIKAKKNSSCFAV